MNWWQDLLCLFNLCRKRRIACGPSYLHDERTDRDYFMREWVAVLQCPRTLCGKVEIVRVPMSSTDLHRHEFARKKLEKTSA